MSKLVTIRKVRVGTDPRAERFPWYAKAYNGTLNVYSSSQGGALRMIERMIKRHQQWLSEENRNA